jgi:hypothetical protein
LKNQHQRRANHESTKTGKHEKVPKVGRAEDRIQKTEYRRQNTEDRIQETEDRRKST